MDLEYRSKPEMEYLLTPNFPTDGIFARTKFSHRTKQLNLEEWISSRILGRVRRGEFRLRS